MHSCLFWNVHEHHENAFRGLSQSLAKFIKPLAMKENCMWTASTFCGTAMLQKIFFFLFAGCSCLFLKHKLRMFCVSEKGDGTLWAITDLFCVCPQMIARFELRVAKQLTPSSFNGCVLHTEISQNDPSAYVWTQNSLCLQNSKCDILLFAPTMRPNYEIGFHEKFCTCIVKWGKIFKPLAMKREKRSAKVWVILVHEFTCVLVVEQVVTLSKSEEFERGVGLGLTQCEVCVGHSLSSFLPGRELRAPRLAKKKKPM